MPRRRKRQNSLSQYKNLCTPGGWGSSGGIYTALYHAILMPFTNFQDPAPWILTRSMEPPPNVRRLRPCISEGGAGCSGAAPAGFTFSYPSAIAHKPVSKRACEGVPRSTAWRSCRKRGGYEVMRLCTTRPQPQHAHGLLPGADCSLLAFSRTPTPTSPPRAPTRPQPPPPAAPAGSTCSVPGPRRPTGP